MPRLVVDAFGTTVLVHCADADRDRLSGQWARCLLPDDTAVPDDVPTLTHPGGELTDSHDYALASALTTAAITDQAGERLMFHACGLADPASGRVAVLVAASGTGKTTAAVRLSQAGLGYVSDETIAVDADDTVRRYPKPVSVVIDPAVPYAKSQHGPDELAMTPAPDGDLRAAAVVLLRRSRDTPRAPELTAVPLIDGLIELIPQTSALPRIRQPLRRLADLVASLGGPWRLDYCEIGEATDLVRTALTSRRPPLGFVHHPPPATGDEDRSEAKDDAATGARALRRGDYLDAIEHDGRVLLLRGNQPIVLDGLGALAWLHADTEDFDRDDLLALARESFGDHPDAERLVDEAVGELLDHGVLRAH